jgi:hypothetical protein
VLPLSRQLTVLNGIVGSSRLADGGDAGDLALSN